MIVRISSPLELRVLFRYYGRENNFSLDGLEALLDYYDSVDCNTELDVIEICCSWTEYNDENDVVSDYGYLVNEDDFENDSEYYNEVFRTLKERTTVLDLDGWGIVVRKF